MLFSSVAIDHLLLFAMFGSFFTLFPGVVIQLLTMGHLVGGSISIWRR